MFWLRNKKIAFLLRTLIWGPGVLSFTHISLASFCGTYANSAELDPMPRNEASDQGFHCLLTECSINI